MTKDFDFYGEKFQNDPVSTFNEMLEECPFHHSRKYGWYTVFRYNDIMSILKDNKLYSARFGPDPGNRTGSRAFLLVQIHRSTVSSKKQLFRRSMLKPSRPWSRGSGSL